MRSKLSAILAMGLLVVSGLLAAQTPVSRPGLAKHVDAILSKMTLGEKLDYIGGYDGFYIRAIPRLGVPALKMADGPMGVRNYGPSTAYPAGIAMAASWDTVLVNRVGQMMGKDARARGVHFLLGPGMNIYRAPMNGRNFEYFGEDPFLASRMAVADITGIQSQGVIATAKHYAANNQEWDRHRISSDVDERTLREIYLPAFEASVKEAHVGAVMDSYNLVNGVHSTQNSFLNRQVLRQNWGFTGIVMADWGATYDGVAAANGGLDLEMPAGAFMNQRTLIPAIREGKVSEATIDEKVRHILRTAMEFGFFDRNQTDSTIPLANPEARQVAEEATLGSMVLLKNDGVLPFDKSKLKTVAVIGPVASPAVTGGGGSSRVTPFSSVSFLEGVKSYLGSGVHVLYSAGVPVMSAMFTTTTLTTEAGGGQEGVTGEYFDNQHLQGTPALVRTDDHIDFHWGQGGYATNGPADHFSSRWTGYFTPKESASYRFYVSGDDGYRLYVDDKPVIERWQNQGETLVTADMQLEARKAYKIRLEYYEDSGDASVGFGIGRSEDQFIQQAKETAAKADVVILCLGFAQTTEGEGADRSFELPGTQNELARQVLAANKNTVIVLTAGGNVDMNPWIEATPALLHAWYPGQEGGTALAKILFGEVSPSGKLPVSFERRWEDSATYTSYYDPKLPAGLGGDAPHPTPEARGHVGYKEGLFLGYRHFDKSGLQPLFPFGYGLSYTTFKYSNLRIAHAGRNGEPVTVSFDISNIGNRAGAEIAQVYVSEQHPKVERPVKELKGFSKVSLKPGETKRVKVTLDRRAFAYYDVNRKGWAVDPGQFEILVSSSSVKPELRGSITIAR